MRKDIEVRKEPVPFDLPNVNPYVEPTVPCVPFLGHLKEQEDEAQAFRMLEGLKKLKINRSLIRTVKRMPEYLMYVKNMFSSKKPIEEEDAVRLNDRCSTALQNQPPPKENDPGSFTLPCLIGNSNIRSALADLGASINIMPFSMFKRLQIGNLQPTNMMGEMADMAMKAPRGIIENVLVQIDKFIFPVDFVIMDMVEDPNIPLILGRPLLATAHAQIDVHSVIIKPEPFIHTQLMSPLYGVFKTSKSSTKPYKVDRDITSPKWLMHVSGACLILGCRETFQARLVGCYTYNDDVACDGGCCSRKQSWSIS
ncbi:transposon ty3-I gag-pol polyprotein [Tanacetum coccineum]